MKSLTVRSVKNGGVGCKEENFLPYNPRRVLDINFIQLKTYLGTKPKVDGPVRFRNTET